MKLIGIADTTFARYDMGKAIPISFIVPLPCP